MNNASAGHSSANLANLEQSVPVWKARPFQLVSLLEMLEHNANLFYFTARQLQELQAQIAEAIKERGGDALPNKDETAKTRILIERIKGEAERLQFHDVLDRIELNFAIYEESLQPFAAPHPFTLVALQFHLKELSREITKALGENKFMMIPANQVGYYNHPKLFGQKVHKNFKSSRVDVKEAGNCYATGRNTACVFHCMRVVEKGLHALVHELNNTFQTNIIFNKQVEFINWGMIIEKIEAEIKELLKPTRQPRLAQSDLQFYSETAKEFVYFKNAWRDDVSHSRSSYDPDEAKVVMEHVKAFMQQLAARIHE